MHLFSSLVNFIILTFISYLQSNQYIYNYVLMRISSHMVSEPIIESLILKVAGGRVKKSKKFI